MTTPRRFSLLLLVADIAAVVIVFNVIAWARGIAGPGWWITEPLGLPAALTVAGLHLIDGYRRRTDMMSLDYTSQHLLALIGALVLTLMVTYIVIPKGYPLQLSRAVIAVSFALIIPTTLLYRRTAGHRTARQEAGRSLCFIGERSAAEEFAREVRESRAPRPALCLILGEDGLPDRTDPRTSEALSALEALHTKSSAGESPVVEAVVLSQSASGLPPTLSTQLSHLFFGGVPIYTLELFHEVEWRKIPLSRLNPVWLYQAGFQIAREPAFERVKRFTDIVLGLVGLAFGAPVLLLAALAVKADGTGGPVLFRQTRIGRDRVPFTLFKLRTMRPAAAGDSVYTATNDSRITLVGRLLRRSRVDEWPQMWNVVRGDMSLIGPRAEWDRLVEEYERQIPCYHFRHLVRPGITGWAQVNYPYGASLEDTLRKLEYDLYYIRHYSLVLDASIVLKTIHLMMAARGR